MRFVAIGTALLLGAGTLFAAERKFDLSSMTVGEAPTGFTSTVYGQGKPGDWKVLLDDVPVEDPAGTNNTPKTAKKSVLAQMSVADMSEEHYPLLVLGDEMYSDFTFRTRLKIKQSIFGESAGIAFRIKDRTNYYALQANVITHRLEFFKVERGVRGKPIGITVQFNPDGWYDLAVECKGTQIRVFLEGEEWPLHAMTDTSFAAGKIGLITKADSVATFADMTVSFSQKMPYAQLLVRDTLKDYPKLVGLKVFMNMPPEQSPHVVASSDEKDIGQNGEKTLVDVIGKGINYYKKEKEVTWVTLPLRDRNGEIVAAVRVISKTFPGQTEENAVVRAMTVVKDMQQRASSVNSLLE